MNFFNAKPLKLCEITILTPYFLINYSKNTLSEALL